jgi:enoyl-CoA hydratase
MLTGRQIPAEEAHSIGLVDRLVDEGHAADAALTLARELRALSLPAQQALIRTVDASFDRELADGCAYEVEQVREVFEHGEAREGMRAFLQKRSPDFA